MKGLRFIFIEFQSLDMTYLPIFSGCEFSDVVIFA
jgi:hypothetical protein